MEHNPKIEEKKAELDRLLSENVKINKDGIGGIDLYVTNKNGQGGLYCCSEDIKSLFSSSLQEVFESGRLQGLNEALGVGPKEDEIPSIQVDIYLAILSTYRDKIKSLIDKK